MSRGQEADLIATAGGFAGALVGGVPGMIFVGGATSAFAEYWRDGEMDSSVVYAGLTGAALSAVPGGVLGGVSKDVRLLNPKGLWESLRNLPFAVHDWKRADEFGAKLWPPWRNAKNEDYLPRPWAARFGAAGGAYVNSHFLWGSLSAHNGLDVLPVMDILPANGRQPTGMAQMVMPNMNSQNPDYPDEYNFGPIADGIHRELPENYSGYYLSAGDPDRIAPPDILPKPPTVEIGANLPDPPPPGSSVAGFNESASDTYRDLVARLRNAALELHEGDRIVVENVNRTSRDLEKFRSALNSSIEAINNNAKLFPPNSMTKDEHILGYIGEAIDFAVSSVQDVLDKINENARGITNPPLPGIHPPGPATVPGDVPAVPPVNPQDQIGTIPPVSPGAFTPIQVPDLGSDDRVGSDVPDLERLVDAASGNPGGVPSVSSGLQNPLGGAGMSGLNGMPGLWNQMRPIDPNVLSSSEGRRVPEVRGSREVAPPPAVPSLTPKPAPVTAATTTAAPTAATATGTGTSPTHATQSSATTNGAPPTRAPEADGGVWYDFPPAGSGVRQKVSPLVAKALDAAFGNADGTNAQLAYQGTSAKWSNSKEMAPVGPEEAITGCVAMWERPSEGSSPSEKPHSGQPGKNAPERTPIATTAVLVVFRMAEGNTEGVTGDSLEVIVDGQRVPYTDQLSGKAGAFGDFAGFGKPRGVELVGSAPGDAMPAQPHPSDTGSVDTLIAAGTVSGG